MTGYELLAALTQLSDDDLRLPVSMEGCDCDGECSTVDVMDGFVYLGRKD